MNRALVGTLAVCGCLGFLVACDSPSSSAVVRAQEAGGQAGDVPLFVDPASPTLDELRAAHAVTGEGAACEIDRDCTSPLRCDDAVCTWPPGMTGQVDGSTPMILLRGDGGEQQYFLEIALTSNETQRGLMNRRVMVPNFGMLFVFEGDRPRSFWMRNTLIPLDMIFIRSDGVIDSFVENAEPLTETPRESHGPAHYVLELNAGEVERIGLRAGTPVAFMNLPAEIAPTRD